MALEHAGQFVWIGEKWAGKERGSNKKKCIKKSEVTSEENVMSNAIL